MAVGLPQTRPALQNAVPSGIKASDIEPPSRSRHFVVGQNRDGRWIVKDSRGLAGGIFISSQAAIDYAAFETAHRPGAVRLVQQLLELEM